MASPILNETPKSFINYESLPVEKKYELTIEMLKSLLDDHEGGANKIDWLLNALGENK